VEAVQYFFELFLRFDDVTISVNCHVFYGSQCILEACCVIAVCDVQHHVVCVSVCFAVLMNII